MKRRLLIIIAIFLLLGAVVNVAVAWGCALWMEVGGRGTYGEVHFVAARHWIVDWSESWGFTRVEVWSFPPEPGTSYLSGSTRPSLPTWWAIQVPDPSIDPSIETWQISDAFGWPYLAMAASFSAEISNASGLIVKSTFDGVLLTAFDPVADVGRGLPIRPLWSAFAVNTLFYAAILWLLLLGVFALRRFLRLRRGLCPKCAYPMGESAVCSECGEALPRRRRVPVLP